MFDEAVGIIQEHRHNTDIKFAESVLEAARQFYLRRKGDKKAKSLFDPDQEQLEYVEDNILLDECDADVLVSPSKHQEAADIHIDRKKPTRGAPGGIPTPPRCVKTSEVFSAWEVNNHNRDLRRPLRSLGAREVFGCS